MRECGFVVCRKGRKYAKGPVACGTPNRVEVPISCPPGYTPIAVVHNHPSGSPYPSIVDVKNLRKVGIPISCIIQGRFDSGRVKCYRIDK